MLLDYGADVLFIAGNYGSDVGDAFINSVRYSGRRRESDVLEKVIAVLAVKYADGEDGASTLCDLYVRHPFSAPVSSRHSEMMELLADHRVVSWQDELREALLAGTITPAEAAESHEDDKAVSEFLKQWISASPGATATA